MIVVPCPRYSRVPDRDHEKGPVMSVFDDLAGQDRVVGELRAAAAAALAGRGGRAGGESGTGGESTGTEISEGRAGMTHAWLFTGPPGSGRSVAARAFAAAPLCPDLGCGQCASCH